MELLCRREQEQAAGRRLPPYHLREVGMPAVLRGTAFAPFAAERAKTTNSAGDAHAPNSASAAPAMAATRSAGLSPLHWLQQRCAARTLAGSMALPPFEMGTISSSSSAYGCRAG